MPYPGMDKLLRDLKAAGKHLMVATSKPKETAVKIPRRSRAPPGPRSRTARRCRAGPPGGPPHFGIQEAPDNLTHFIGPPLDESFPEFYGFDQGQVDTGPPSPRRCSPSRPRRSSPS